MKLLPEINTENSVITMINKDEDTNHYKNNSTPGYSLEYALTVCSGLDTPESYKELIDTDLVDQLIVKVKEFLNNHPEIKIVKMIAQENGPTDFILEGGQTLSVKSSHFTKDQLAPQVIGQSSRRSFFNNESIKDEWGELLPKSYNWDENSSEDVAAEIFKDLALNHSDKLLPIYWKGLFSNDYLLYVDNLLDAEDTTFTLLQKIPTPKFDKDKITFTQTKDSWCNSNTVKYQNVSLGSFQIHRTRDVLQFRFNLKGLRELKLTN